jgi:alpha-ribazole phosphatase
MKIYMIRHTSVAVEPGVCYGQSDVDLRPTFEEEAAVSRSRIEGKHFDHVYCSPLSRCVRLATACGYPDAQRDDRLKEINFGDWELQRFDDITDQTLEEWYKDYLNVRPPHGESFYDQLHRVSAFLEELRASATDKDEQVLIFAHGGVLICAQLFAGVVTPEHAVEALTPYGGMIEIEL